MAIQKKSLRLAYDAGNDADGKQKVSTRTYSDILTTAEDAAIKTVADALNTLTEKPALYAETVTVSRLD